MPDWLYAIINGLIEGITEFIPVSSTGHLLVGEKLMHHAESDLFNIVIQGGAVLAVVPLFWKQFCGMIFGLGDPKNRDLAIKLFVAFALTCGVGFILDKKGYKLPEDVAPVAWALLIGGIIIFGVESLCKRRVLSERLTWPLVIIFFLGQIIAAVFPGASRSGSTIMLAMLFGMTRPAATEFTFLLGVPTLLAASAWKLLKALKEGGLHNGEVVHLGIGFVVAAVSSFIVVKWLIRYVQHHTFNGFAIYRILLGALLFGALAAGWIEAGPSASKAKHAPAAAAKP